MCWSSTEAKFVALSEASREAIYLKRLLKEIYSQDDNNPVTINMDYLFQSHMNGANLLMSHVTKTVKAVELKYMCTKSNVANINVWTMSLSKIRFKALTKGLGLQPT